MELPAPANRVVSSLPAGAPLLSLVNVSHRFNTVLALDNASMNVRAGTVHALLGGNGAGKTTLMRVAFGLQRPDAGKLLVRGVEQRIASPADALRLGIGMVHQHFTLVPAMTVAENVALGGSGRFNPRDAEQRVRNVAAHAGLVIDPMARVHTLGVDAQQRCEIVKALARNVELLILDEPTAVLAPAEAAVLLQWMRAFADRGGAVVLITHKLRDALQVADDVTVLRDGRVVLQAHVDDVDELRLMRSMVGAAPTADDASTAGATHASEWVHATAVVHTAHAEDTSNAQHAPDVETATDTIPHATTSHAPAGSHAHGPTVLALHNVSYTDASGATRVRGVSLDVHAGEIVGIAGVDGAGQQELLRLLAGRLAPDMGRVTIPERVGFIPDDRHRDALMLDASLHENMALKDAGMRTGRMPWRAIRAATTERLQERQIMSGGTDVLARTLSGGNQQKLVLARELSDTPSAVVAVNPTRGLDFEATASIHDALREARNAGAALVVYSSDLDEVLLLADRMFVMHAGALIPTARDREAAGRAMLGVE